MLPSYHLWGHVSKRANRRLRDRDGADPEVDEDRVPLAYHDVFVLDVAMDHSHKVNVLQSVH